MRVRSALLAVLLCVPAVAMVEGGADHVGADDPVEVGRSRRITVTGVVERLVVDTRTNEQVRYAVRGAGRTWWLEGLDEPAPEPGSVVEIIGIRSDAYTLTVETVRVLDRSEATSSMATSLVAPRSTRVLVIPVYSGARPPSWPTRATLQETVITDSRAWFEEVSHGRYSVSGTVTRWLKISRPPTNCEAEAYQLRDQALAAARRAGYKLARFGRFIFVPAFCTTSSAGMASMPGQYVWLFGVNKIVVMHEQGHNLGLPHAGVRVCRSKKWGIVTWSSDCQIVEMGDNIDPMGGSAAGHYSAYYKSRLGWLQRFTTVTSSRTVILTPYETTGPGLKAVRVKTGGMTYWLEYRRRTGTDAEIAEGAEGVQIRVQAANGTTQLLDAAPGSTPGPYEFSDTHVTAGSSWTTAEKVRFTVTRQTPSTATVAITFGAGAPRPPRAPSPLRIGPIIPGGYQSIRWTRPADNGAIIRRYTITRSDGATRTITDLGGRTTFFSWGFPERGYTYSVKATNQFGTSAAATAPLARIISPRDGATVTGVVPIQIEATPSPATSPIKSVSLYLEVEDLTGRDRYVKVTTDQEAPWGPLQWDTRLGSGSVNPLTKVVVEDAEGDTTTIYRRLNVRNSPAMVITSPHDGDTVTGQVDVTYTLSPASDEWDQVKLWVDGETWDVATEPGQPFSLDTTQLTPGSHSLSLTVTSRFGESGSEWITVTVPDP